MGNINIYKHFYKEVECLIVTTAYYIIHQGVKNKLKLKLEISIRKYKPPSKGERNAFPN